MSESTQFGQRDSCCVAFALELRINQLFLKPVYLLQLIQHAPVCGPVQWCPQASPVRAACLRLANMSTKQASKPKGWNQASKRTTTQAAWLCLI